MFRYCLSCVFFFFSSRRRHTRFDCDWSADVCSSDLLPSEGEPGEKVTVTSAWDSEEEARVIGEEIEALARSGHSLDEIAILVRASFQMREFEDRFVTLGLPYRVIGGPRFYERAEI